MQKIVAAFFYIGFFIFLFTFSSSDSSRNISPTPTPTPLVSEYLREYFSNRNPCDIRDCGGFEAGYYWAEEEGLLFEGECGGDSDEFIEGCQAYVRENFSDLNTDYEYDPNSQYEDVDYWDFYPR